MSSSVPTSPVPTQNAEVVMLTANDPTVAGIVLAVSGILLLLGAVLPWVLEKMEK